MGQITAPSTSGEYIAREDGSILGRRGEPIKQVLKKNGYLHFSMSEGHGKPNQTLVHRFIYQSLKGDIPDGMVVDHIDGDRLNNKVDNLQLLTPAENCRKSKSTKLTKELSKQIFERRFSGESGRALSREFGISEQVVCDIFKGRRWVAE